MDFIVGNSRTSRIAGLSVSSIPFFVAFSHKKAVIMLFYAFSATNTNEFSKNTSNKNA